MRISMRSLFPKGIKTIVKFFEKNAYNYEIEKYEKTKSSQIILYF